ncbi:MAG: hypothetical protein ACLFU4_06185 [Opitutales bacterium]
MLVRVPERDRAISDAELLRRFRVLYPKPTKYQTASFKRFEAGLQAGVEEALAGALFHRRGGAGHSGVRARLHRGLAVGLWPTVSGEGAPGAWSTLGGFSCGERPASISVSLNAFAAALCLSTSANGTCD